jgi:hypothetical protein
MEMVYAKALTSWSWDASVETFHRPQALPDLSKPGWGRSFAWYPVDARLAPTSGTEGCSRKSQPSKFLRSINPRTPGQVESLTCPASIALHLAFEFSLAGA